MLRSSDGDIELEDDFEGHVTKKNNLLVPLLVTITAFPLFAMNCLTCNNEWTCRVYFQGHDPLQGMIVKIEKQKGVTVQ